MYIYIYIHHIYIYIYMIVKEKKNFKIFWPDAFFIYLYKTLLTIFSI